VLGVELTATSPAAALDAAAAALDRMRADVLGAGVPESALQTSRLSVQPEWSHEGQRPRLVGYTAHVGLTVTVGDPGRIGAVLAAAVSDGGDVVRVYSLGWRLRDSAAAEQDARHAAFADARERAEHYAALSGCSLGQVLQVDERGDDFRPRGRAMPVRYSGAASMEMGVDPGEVAVTATVTVTWELT
jgi:uncharacterized protein YggE